MLATESQLAQVVAVACGRGVSAEMFAWVACAGVELLEGGEKCFHLKWWGSCFYVNTVKGF
jgi:hypothetical protein